MTSNHDTEPDAAAVKTTADLARVLRALRRREARLRHGPELTYREMSERTGWSVSVVGGYFTGVKLPSTERFDELVLMLGARPHERGLLATAWERAAAGRGDDEPLGSRVRSVIAPRMFPRRSRASPAVRLRWHSWTRYSVWTRGLAPRSSPPWTEWRGWARPHWPSTGHTASPAVSPTASYM